MRFGIFYEISVPRPWEDDIEHTVYHRCLEQVRVADEVGFHSVWAVEHHFLEEYSHSSAPEVFLAAASQRTQNIRLGHGIVLMPPGYNHPARVAERIATLDLVSNGRVEFGTGESASRAELEGYRVNPEQRREMWLETVEQVANMLAMNPYPGYEGVPRGPFQDIVVRNDVEAVLSGEGAALEEWVEAEAVPDTPGQFSLLTPRLRHDIHAP